MTELLNLGGKSLLTPESVTFFRTFGYVVLSPEPLTETMVALEAECRRVLDIAYPGEPQGALQLPVMSAETPLSVTLLHNDLLVDAISTLIGSCAVLKPAKITRFAGPTNWHRDCYMLLNGVKVAIYFLNPGEDAVEFNLVPASHTGVVREYIDNIFSKARPAFDQPRNPDRKLPPKVPVHEVRLRRNDFLLFDLGLWHANLSHSKRLQWSVTFLERPRNNLEVLDAVSHLGEFFEYAKPYPRDRFPYLPAPWEAGADDSIHARALLHSGVLTEYLSRYGHGR